ncbi:putative periplasmic binding protein-like I [Helianthus debilis subsp. tardiflorus]
MQHKHHNHNHHHAILLLIINLILTTKGTKEIGIGVILDMESNVGMVSTICIKMALHDFYQKHNYTTKIIPHFRDSKYDRVEAASAAIQLIKDVKVMAIIGPQRSSQADFVVDIGNKAMVPILSLASTPYLSPKNNPYFIRVSHTTSSQAQPIAALINFFPWREVVFVYQHDDFGTGLIPSLSEALLKVGVQIKQKVLISHFASDEAIFNKLHNLKTNPTRVFVVHLSPELASRFFKKAKQAGMMQEEYAWIVTDIVTNLLHTLDVESMQRVMGVKPYIPVSDDLKNFGRKFKRNNPSEVINAYGLWLYDTTYALAMALERVGSATTFQQHNQQAVTDLDAIGTSKLGPRLLSEISNTKLKGLSGNFDLVDGQLQSDSGYQIVNIVGQEDKPIYMWTNRNKISNKEAIEWPGGSNNFPRGWEIPATKESKLRVGYPEIGGSPEFIQRDPNNANVTEPIGFCVDVFKAVMKKLPLPYPPSYEYISFPVGKSATSGGYKDLIDRFFKQKYDMVIGDVTIRADRASYVDFTLPYTESGVAMIVPIKRDDTKNAWIFMRPLEKQLWLTTCAFFIYTGVVVWVLEHRVNKEFRGPPYKQVGMIFWFSLSTLVFAHKEKIISNLSRFVVIVWVFVVLVLQTSYIASLTSMLTIQQLQPAFKDIHDLMRQGDNVGYREGSFVAQMLRDMGFEDAKLKGYDSLETYDHALSNGSVSAIFDELPYLKLFLANHRNKYMMVGPTYKSAGFGFAFPKGSPLLPLVSKALLQVTENELNNITEKWFGQKANCSDQDMGSRSGRLSLESFLGLFLIAGVSSTSALVIYFFNFLYENKDMLLYCLIVQFAKSSLHLQQASIRRNKSKRQIPQQQITMMMIEMIMLMMIS